MWRYGGKGEEEGVGVGVCNYKGAACKTEIMKEKKRKTLTQFLALTSQGQTPDWALRDDGGDEWDGDANMVRFSVCCLCRRAAPFVLATFFFYWFSKEPQLSVLYMLGHHACKLPCVDVCFVWSQDVLMCNVAQLSSTIFFILFLLQTLQNLKAPVCKIKRHLMAENDIARKKHLLIFLFM